VLNFLVESFGLLNDLFPFPSILDAGYPVFDLHLADVVFDVILPSVVGSCDLLVRGGCAMSAKLTLSNQFSLPVFTVH